MKTTFEEFRLLLWQACDEARDNGKVIGNSFSDCPLFCLYKTFAKSTFSCILLIDVEDFFQKPELALWVFIRGFDDYLGKNRDKFVSKEHQLEIKKYREYYEMGCEFRKEYLGK